MLPAVECIGILQIWGEICFFSLEMEQGVTVFKWVSFMTQRREQAET